MQVLIDEASVISSEDKTLLNTQITESLSREDLVSMLRATRERMYKDYFLAIHGQDSDIYDAPDMYNPEFSTKVHELENRQ
jgi:hypothetical protein